MNDEFYMAEAIKEAKKAFEKEETPIGAIIVLDNKIIARGHNERNTKKNPLAHGEMIAINNASKIVGDWRLEGCTMYVTLEPCPMCAGAIVQSRMSKIVIGASNYKSGSAGTIINLLNIEQFNHQVEIKNGILMDECSNLLKNFFKALRNKKLEIINTKEHIDI